MEPDLTFSKQISNQSGQNVARCYYCLRCSAGCPVTHVMDYGPAQVLRMIQLGQKDALLRSSAIWLCVGCETCGTRCPNGIRTGLVIDALRQMALAEGIAPAEREVVKLHQAFLDSIRIWGRVHELSMLAQYKLTSLDLFSDLDMGLDMFLKGKIHPFPKRIKGRDEVAKLFEMESEG
ncbi:MAG: 4Fe-4S dicluster domain-containing protein [Chloroflexi bacterium]|nr:4Fe-4S dicluster domain-containing protein [Chloroflexota bacterium]MBU1749310.1 4Fe-4S dicluster domain-containing protein [Chloroflexota bacterium]MBU1878359.1 4Fe-4S dicluster domain-containing protein [Chloroflexota bacterium]